MADVIFYEKPGCAGNARQKVLLLASGHRLDVRNLLTESWSAETLLPFLVRRPVCEWFNTSSPRVKSGEVKPDQLTAESALALMLKDPLLIRRPLMQVGDRREAGFDQAKVAAWIGLRETSVPVQDTCLKEQSRAHAPRCGATAEV